MTTSARQPVTASATGALATLGIAADLGANEGLEGVRQAAFARFAETGFPSPRAEQWRQLNVAALARRPLQRAPLDAATIGTALSGGISGRLSRLAPDAPTLVLVNGVHRPELDRLLPTHVSVHSLGNGRLSESAAVSALEAAQQNEIEPWAMHDLSLALSGDVVEVRIAAGAGNLDEPLHVVHLAVGPYADAVSAPRIRVVLEAGAELTLVEHVLADSMERPVCLVHSRFELAEQAKLRHLDLPRLGQGGLSIQRCEATIGRAALLESFHCALDDATTRTDFIASLDDEEARFDFSALALARGPQQLDYLVRALHEAPHTHSDQTFKAIATDRAQATFTTCARVAQDAQQIESEQLARGILLSENAAIHTRPQLEIYADDVVCAHGATVGQLDEDALFYLRARGVPLATARSMLLDAFTEDMLEGLAETQVAAEARARAYAFTHADDLDPAGDNA